jgi:hypothetical protein
VLAVLVLAFVPGASLEIVRAVMLVLVVLLLAVPELRVARPLRRTPDALTPASQPDAPTSV